METPFPFRIGTGYDVHRITDGRKLVLGGVAIPSTFGLDGHSDADVLTHAIADAVLGALGLPDIGHFFPPGEATWKDMDSQEILRLAVEKASSSGFVIANVDAVLVAEAPSLAPHVTAIKQQLSATLGIPADRIGIKATTNEGLGWIGQGKGMSAQAVVLIAQKELER